MAKETYLYEVLIRGKRGGEISGSHMIYMDVLTVDGTDEVIERAHPAEALDPAAVEALLGKEMANIAAQLATAKSDVAAAQAAQAAAEENAGAIQRAFEAQCAALQQKLDAALSFVAGGATDTATISAALAKAHAALKG